MQWHRNSQKRIYVPDGIYFLTFNTANRHPYFENEIFCELFLETLDFSSLIKEFNIHGWAINLEHLHLLIEPTGKYNYSEIMGTIKRNFSRDCNDLMAGKNFLRDGNAECDDSGSDDPNHRHDLTRKYIDIRGNSYFKAHLEKLCELQNRFHMNCNQKNLLPFKWQSSFRDHLIRDEKDYQNHLEYIKNQPLNIN